MALVVKDRVQETCNSPGTGAVTLLGAATGYQTFSSAVGNGNTCYYAIADQGGANWEVGYGTYSSSGNTLARTTVLASSNGGSLTNFSSGIQNVWVDYPAGKAVYLDSSGNVNALGTISSATWQASTIGVAYGGTGLTSLTANYIPYGNGTGALSSSSTLTYSGSLLSVNGTSGLAGLGNAQLALNPATGGAYYVANRSSSSAGEVGFAFETAGAINWINYIATSGSSLNWYNGSSVALSLSTAGNLSFPLSGTGINFNNGASYLNYYETGTYSPTVTNTSGAISYSASGTYTRVGKLITVSVVINISSATPGSVIFSLPYQSNGFAVVTGRENAATGATINGYASSASTCLTWLYNNGATAITSYGLIMSTTYTCV